MRVTLRPRLFATHTAPNPVATPSGWASTSTKLPGFSVRGLMGTAPSVPWRVTQTSPLSSFHAKLSGVPFTGTLLVSVINSGFTRLTSPPSR